MIAYSALQSIEQIGRDRWNALYPAHLERYEYLLAVERSGMKDFGWRYVVAQHQEHLIAAVPAFLTDYSLDTTLPGVGRRFVAGLRRIRPRALKLRLACMGSPCTETIGAGFLPELDVVGRRVILEGMLRAFESEARANDCALLGLKDVPIAQQEIWKDAARASGFRQLPGMPSASLDVNFTSIDQYLKSLSAGARRDMRRKLRARSQIRIERRHNIDDVLDEVVALYAQTRCRAELQFEELTPEYFRGVLAQVPGASCALYFVHDRLLAANLLIENRQVLLDKFFCMNAEAGRAFNLYFLSWFANVEYCLQRGLHRYLSGQAGYANKLRLGSELGRTWLYFRHRNAFINAALQVVAPLFTATLNQEAA